MRISNIMSLMSENRLSDRVFSAVEFGSFIIKGESTVIRDCSFLNCTITQSAFQILAGVHLENVTFENCNIIGDYDIHSGVSMKNVKFKTKNENDTLWVKNTLGEIDFSKNDIELDISDFVGTVIITGNNVENVKLNTNEQIFVSGKILNQTRFKLPRSNFFRSSGIKVKVNGSKVGVFSLPKMKRNPDEFNEQFSLFKELGYIGFDLDELLI